MKTIIVVMSTFNGEKCVERQLDSIFSQKSVDVMVYVRDDGSTDNTKSILVDYKKRREPERLFLSFEENCGWERSFMQALAKVPHADFYAFSDQDDIWFDNKLIAGIEALGKYNQDCPLLYHCNKLSVYDNMIPLRHQVRRTPRPLNHQNAMIQEFAQGCSIIMNEKARELVTSYFPSKKIPHDFWCGLICYLFGKVIYDDNRYFYHISYGTNASGEGHMISSWKHRFSKLIHEQEAYNSPYQDLLHGFEDKLCSDDKLFIHRVLNYKTSILYKFYLLFSPKFIRDSVLGTLSLKTAILFNKI